MDNLTGLIFPGPDEDLYFFIVVNKIKRIKFNKYMLDDEEWVKKYTYNLSIFLKFSDINNFQDEEHSTLIVELFKTNNIRTIEIALIITKKLFAAFGRELLDLQIAFNLGNNKTIYYYLYKFLIALKNGKYTLLNHAYIIEIFQKYTPFIPEDDYISALKKCQEIKMRNFNLYQVRIKIPKYILLKIFDKYLN
jgi:hypothetical protein